MPNIHFISTTIVKASATNKSSSWKKRTRMIKLSSNDVKFLLIGYNQMGLLFHKPKSSSELKFSDENLIHNLKNSLSSTLDFFFPFAGRLAMVENSDNTAHFFIDCNNSGVQFVHAIAENITIFDIVEPVHHPPVLHLLFPMNGSRNHEGFSKPLLGVQVTELVDGIFMGFIFNHSAADGSTFWHFVNSWSEISRNNSDNHMFDLPVYENWFRDENYCPPVNLSNFISKITDNNFPPSPSQERIFHFSKENIGRLKARANMESAIDNISSLQSILAHVWRSVIRCQQLDPEEDTNFYLTIGLRSRLHPPIPESYFGNAIDGFKVTVKVRDLLKNGLGFVALHMYKMVNGYTRDKFKANIEAWKSKPTVPTLNFHGRTNTLVISSSPRFDVYGNDFGWGRPIAVRSGPTGKFDGLVTVFQGLEEGSVDVEVCHLAEVLQAMENDSEFVDAVTIV